MHTRTARTLTVAALLLASVTALPAQVQMPAGPTSVGTFSWGYAMPAGGTTDFIDNDSFLSFAFEGEKFIKRTASVGLFFGWTELYERTDETVQIGNGAISGGQYRHANVFPDAGHDPLLSAARSKDGHDLAVSSESAPARTTRAGFMTWERSGSKTTPGFSGLRRTWG